MTADLHLVPKPPTEPLTEKCDHLPLRSGTRWLRTCRCHRLEPLVPAQRKRGSAS